MVEECIIRHFELFLVYTPTKRLSTRNEEGIDLQAETLVERTLLPAIKFAFHTGFSRCVETGAFHLPRISGFSCLQRSQRARAHHCYVILITMMSKQARDQFWPVKTCKMRCYRVTNALDVSPQYI